VDAPAAVLLERALAKSSLPWAPLLVLLLREHGRRLPAATHAAWLQARPGQSSSSLGFSGGTMAGLLDAHFSSLFTYNISISSLSPS